MSQAPLHDSVSAGALLASVRQELNLSVPEVARHLKLSPAQVEALEAGAYDRLPGRTFVRGFLRNYAKLLGVDPQPLLHSIEYQIPRPENVEEMRLAQEVVIPHGERSRWPLYSALAAVIVVGLLAVYEFGFNDAGRGGETATANAVAPVSAEGVPTTSAPATGAGAPAATGTAPTAAAAPGAGPAKGAGTGAALPPPAVASAPAASAALPQVSPPATEPKAPSAGAAGERALRLVFKEDSWVEIRDGNNKVIFSRLNRAGAEERVSGTPPFKLVVGNARGVRLTYDEKPIDLVPHTGVTVARLTLE